MNYAEHSDEDLFVRLQTDDQKALRVLFDRHYEPLCRLARSMAPSGQIAEDAVIRVFERLWRNRSGDKPRSSVKAYLFAAVRNQTVSILRSEKRRDSEVEHTEMADQEAAINEPSAPEHLETGELLKEVQEAIANLPQQRQEAFRLSRFEGLRYKEIAEIMGISERTVQNHVVMALLQLRPHLEEIRRTF